MEDEGRHFLEAICDTREECVAWIEKECPPGSYFKKSDYYIMRQERE